MALKKRGKYWYGDSQADIRTELLRYSKLNAYVADHFADPECQCGGNLFRLKLDEPVGAAVATCIACGAEHPIGDSDEYLKDAELEECACACGHEEFEITVGVSLYKDSEDVKWLYLGCRCPKCSLTAPYADWKNEYNGYKELFARVRNAPPTAAPQPPATGGPDQVPHVTGAAVPALPELKWTWAVLTGDRRRQPTKSRPSKTGQVRFVMHPDDEREFEQLLLSEESVCFIEGPRWKTEAPLTSRSLADIHDSFCIIWSPNDIAKLNAEYIPTCNDWYFRSGYATIHFWRSIIDGLVITEGRISAGPIRTADFPAASVKSVEKRYGKLRSHIKKTFSNSMLQWRASDPDELPCPERAAEPRKPDPQVWVGPHALRWLRENPDRRVKQSLQMRVEAVLVPAEV